MYEFEYVRITSYCNYLENRKTYGKYVFGYKNAISFSVEIFVRNIFAPTSINILRDTHRNARVSSWKMTVTFMNKIQF